MLFQTISRADLDDLHTEAQKAQNPQPKNLHVGILEIFDNLVHNELQVLIQNFCLSHMRGLKKRKKWRKKNSVRLANNMYLHGARCSAVCYVKD